MYTIVSRCSIYLEFYEILKNQHGENISSALVSQNWLNSR